jgi:hypothetical protein
MLIYFIKRRRKMNKKEFTTKIKVQAIVTDAEKELN